MRGERGPFQAESRDAGAPSGGRWIRKVTLAVAVIAAAFLQCASVQAQTGYGNYPPVAQNDSTMTMEDTITWINVLYNDWGLSGPLNPASIHIVDAPDHGTAVIDPSTGVVWYCPDNDFYGIDSFTYTVSDTHGNTSNAAAVAVMVVEDLSAPMIIDFKWDLVGNRSFQFTGQVVDHHSVAGLTVTFGGCIAGHTAITQSDGSFTANIDVANGFGGPASARVTNSRGIDSAIVYDDVP